MRSELFYKGIPDNLLALAALAFFEGRSLFIIKKYFLPDGNTIDNNLKLHFDVKEVIPNKSGNHLTNENSRTNHTILNYEFKPVYIVISAQKSYERINAESYDRFWIYTYIQLKLNANKLSKTLSFANQNDSCNASHYKIVSQIFNYNTHPENQFSSHLLDKNIITKVKTFNSND